MLARSPSEGAHGLEVRRYIFAGIGVALLVHASRIAVSLQTARRCKSAALRELRLLHAAGGLVVFVSVAVPPEMSLADAQHLASRLEDDIRDGQPQMQDVVVHTEP